MNPPLDRRARTKPAELLGLSAGFGLFVGLIVVLSTRQILLGLIFFAVTFIVSIVTIATLSLTVAASAEERIDLDEQDHGH
jgi:Zn-dependent membrane protease YugP